MKNKKVRTEKERANKTINSFEIQRKFKVQLMVPMVPISSGFTNETTKSRSVEKTEKLLRKTTGKKGK